MDGLGFVRRAILLIGLLVMPLALPTIDFQSHMSTVQLQPTNAQLKLVNVAQVVGWSDRSIVKTFGHNVSSAWPEAYANATVISQSGGTKVPQTELVQANSSAIVVLNPAIRTTSNAVLYGLRVNSNALLYGDRITSNAVVWTSPVVRTSSNAFAFSNRTTSNAVTYSSVPMPIADSIDGTALPRYRTTHHVFHNNGNAWSVRGWVRFNDGFTVMPRASVIMDTLTTVSGAMDLRDTGTLILNNDLYLAHNVTLTNGGNIKGRSSSSGQANTIFMGGDLTLSSTTYARTLHITGDWSNSGTSGDLIIDGCGHTLNIGDRAQIFVDCNVTLTLRNMTIKTGPKSLMMPSIRLASMGSKLALDNVMFDLGADFQFKQGQIFIHDEVAVTGTSAFVYQSPCPSYITSGATWSFEQGITFSVAPATLTDCPFTVNNTYTNNRFIVLADSSSALYLNGCSLKTTYTGLRLTNGMVMLDNRVSIDTMAAVDLYATTPVTLVTGLATGTGPNSVDWSPDGNFLAVSTTGDVTKTVQIFSFDGATLTLRSTLAIGSGAPTVAWSPDGRYLAVDANLLYVYRVTGNSTPIAVGGGVVMGNGSWGLGWSPDGKFLAVADRSSDNIILVYRFDGISTPVLLGTGATGPSPVAVAWSPDGRFLVSTNGDGADNTIQVHRFDGKSAPKLVGSKVATGAYPYYCVWSPDGRFIAVAPYSATALWVHRFDGMHSPTPVGTVATGTNPDGVCWSPDGRYLALVSRGSNSLQLYSFSGSAAPVALGSAVGTNSAPVSVTWSPNGRFLAVVNLGGSTLQIFKCNFVSRSAPQNFTNGLVFGDKAKGVAYDANVQVLSGSVVTINGKVKDDSA